MLISPLPGGRPPDGSPVRLVVADDHFGFRQAVRTLLAGSGHIEVVGEAVDGVDAVRVCTSTLPHVALIDIDMPRLDGIGATRRIAERLPRVRVVVFSGDLGRGRGEAALAAGAVGVFSKDGTPAELIEVVRAAATRPAHRTRSCGSRPWAA